MSTTTDVFIADRKLRKHARLRESQISHPRNIVLCQM